MRPSGPPNEGRAAAAPPPPGEAGLEWLASPRGGAGAASNHAEGEHPLGVDARIERSGVEELDPLRSVTRDVDLEQRFPKGRGLHAADIDRGGAPVHGDGELLGRNIRRTHLRPDANVPEAQRVGSRAEVKRASIEDGIDPS